MNGADYNIASPIASSVSGLSLKGAVQFSDVAGAPRTLIDTGRNNFQPRIGLAYKLHEKWVIRGGYGLYYAGEDALGSTNGFSRQTNAIVSSDGLTPYAGMTTANPFIQRELPFTMLFEVAYTGNTARQLPVNVGLNYVPASELGRRSPART